MYAVPTPRYFACVMHPRTFAVGMGHIPIYWYPQKQQQQQQRQYSICSRSSSWGSLKRIRMGVGKRRGAIPHGNVFLSPLPALFPWILPRLFLTPGVDSSTLIPVHPCAVQNTRTQQYIHLVCNRLPARTDVKNTHTLIILVRNSSADPQARFLI